MKRILTVAALSLSLAPAALPQTATFPDPANLQGERITPHTGRELPVEEGARGLEQLLRKLNTRASLMLIVAHPDDEDGGMLTLYSRGQGARVATLTLTRGEGGQNAMTGDFEDALGLIRTQELLAADRYFGADQMFGTEIDFGFSKTKEEAFHKWTHERVLYDAVRAVRLYRPLVLAAVFIGGVTDGHGQHQVSGEIAQEVFKAAGDPAVFPELTREGILPWQPLKVYARVPMQAITAQGLFDYATNQYTPARFTNYVTGEVTTTPPSVDVTVHEGQTDPLLSASGEPARSYVQFARIGLGLQKTQIGPGVRLAVAGAYDIGYHRYGSRLDAAHQKATETSFFDGIDTTIAGMATLAPAAPTSLRQALTVLEAQLKQARETFNPAKPGELAPLLADALQHTDSLLSRLNTMGLPPEQLADVHHELAVKRVQINDALALALGLTLDATTSAADQPTGSTVQVWANLQQSSATTMPIRSVTLEPGDASSAPAPEEPGNAGADADWANGNGSARPATPGHETTPDLAADRPFKRSLKAGPRETAQPTRPYFFRDSEEAAVYQLRQPALRLAPATPPAFVARASVSFRGVRLDLAHVVHDGPEPLSLTPPFSVTLGSHAQVLPLAERQVAITATVQPPPRTVRDLAVSFDLPPFLERKPATDDPAAGRWRLRAQLKAGSPKEGGTVSATARAADGHTYTEGFRAVGYPGIPRTNFYTPAHDRIVPVDLKLPTRRRIAYLPGTGDAVPDALASVGLPVKTLGVADLTPEHLQQFDTVILGVRTYNAHPDLHGAPTAALLDFARNGGNVVVQYQTAEFTGADAPFPLMLGNAEKVVDETDPVRLLSPSALALSAPNAITPADFDGWIEERGHGFLQTWDKQYTALTETHDPGQAPQEGGLVTAQLGRGHWTYCAFAIYRQLPEAVPGAFRIFVDLLGLADAPAR